MPGPCKGQYSGAWRGRIWNTSARAWRDCAWNEALALRGWAVHRPGAKCTAGPYMELEGTLTAGPRTEGAWTCVAGSCTRCADNLVPCNGQEGSARRGRTGNRPAYVQRSRARNDWRRSRRGRVTDKREVCVGPTQRTGWQVPDGAVHETRREDCTARPYTARGQVHCGAVHGTGGQAHAGAVQRTIWWCVAGPHTEQVGMGMARLCMERGVSIPRLGRTQTGGKVHCGALHGTGGYAHGGATHGRGGDVRRGAVHGMCG